MRTKLLIVFLLLGAFLCFTQPASAATCTFNLNIVIDADTPSGTPPWATAIFDDQGTAGEVFLTMSLDLDDPDEFLGEWFFNYDDAKDVEAISFAYQSGSVANSPVETDENNLRASGDGLFDIRFSWASNVFNNNDTSVYRITGDTVVATDFKFLSEQFNPGTGVYNSAAKVQGIDGPEGSGTIGFVPIPGSVLLLAPGLILLLAVRRKFRSKP